MLPGGWVLYGEAGKIVTASGQRILGLTPTADGFSASVKGYFGESTTSFIVGRAPVATTQTVTCPSGEGVVASLACNAAGCTCN